MKKYTIKKIFAGILTAGMVSLFILPLSVNIALAQSDDASTTDLWSGVSQNLDDSFKSKSLSGVISGLINVIMGALGVVVVIIILWGGFIWMTAGGEADKVEKAKKMIYSGIIGLIIILASYAIATFVLTALNSIG